MLKLTNYHNPDLSIWVFPAHISVIEQTNEYTVVWTNRSHAVNETVEQIMAMEEMVYHLHPPFIVTGGIARPQEMAHVQPVITPNAGLARQIDPNRPI
jgi:hypothetical protein